jgi:iron complex transport system ATP-binding protein
MSLSDMNTPLLSLEALSVRAGKRLLVEAASLTLAPGECVGLIGPNGAGKTTLMRAALGLQAHTGASSLMQLPPMTRAHHVAFLPQQRSVAWPVTVRDLVALGLLPANGPGLRVPDSVADRVDAVLNQMGLETLAERSATEISGGELARVLLARVLVQDTPLVIADEPAASLDPAQQIALMERLCAVAKAGRGVLVSLHDLGLAARYCTRLIVMRAGRIVADGAPLDVLTPAVLADVFQIRAQIFETPDGILLHPVALTGRVA